jgi:multiple sugar transport system ATP-binding protein
MASIRLENVVKQFENGFRAVHEASLEIGDGEFLVLVGPSGCGKSTMLRMVAGLEEVTEGSIYIGDRLVNDVEPGQRDIAMVFQNYALYPHMTVRQNMSFGLKMRRTNPQEIRRRVDEAAAILSIEALLDRRPAQLSGGQRQRVAVGRAIVRQPAAFLFDEPLSNLDARLRVQMRKELAQLHHRLQTTTIYVTHDQVEAMTLGQRIVVMNEGEVQQIASPLELYEKPANCFVAGFIGSPSMNLVEGCVEQDKGQLVFCNDVIRFPVTLPGPTPDPGRPLIFGFRPEHLTLSDRHPQLAELQVDLVERLGDGTMVYFEIAGQSCVARLAGNAACRRGESVALHLPVDQWHLFEHQHPRKVLAHGGK